MASDAGDITGRIAGRRKVTRSGFGWEAMLVTASRFFQRSTFFISSLILARVLGPDGRGLVSALMVPSQLSVSLSELGIRQSTAYHIGKDVFPLERVLPTLLMMIPLASTLAIALSLGYFRYAGIAQNDWLLQGIAVATIPLSLAVSYASGVFLGRQRMAAFRSTSWRPASFRLFLIVILCWLMPFGVYGALIATLAGAMLGAAYAFYLLGKEGRLRLGFDREVATAIQRRGVTYAASMIVLMLNYKIMTLLLTKFSTLAAVGLYTQATVVAELIWEIPMAMSSLVLSRGVNAKREDEFSRKVIVLARISFLAAVIVSTGLSLVAPFAFRILFGHEFAKSADLCVILLPGVVAFIVFKILNTDLAGRGKPWAAMMVMAPVLISNIVLGWWMIVHYGVTGAAAASSISYVVAAIGYVLLYSYITHVPLRDILIYRRSDLTLLLDKLPGARGGKKTAKA
ncbi:hypothetical protein BH10PSE15_BH10PSE15_03530 [soil metagenome]